MIPVSQMGRLSYLYAEPWAGRTVLLDDRIKGVPARVITEPKRGFGGDGHGYGYRQPIDDVERCAAAQPQPPRVHLKTGKKPDGSQRWLEGQRDADEGQKRQVGWKEVYPHDVQIAKVLMREVPQPHPAKLPAAFKGTIRQKRNLPCFA